jgi:CRISPR type III-A-associated RAMP protein Csm4
MSSGFLVRLRPTGPWRFGPESGARDRVDRMCHSDSIYSAVTAAMQQLGLLDEWLDATARGAASAVRFSSCFPWQGKTLYVTPPRTVWPPAASAKVRWKGARFIPLSAVQSLLKDEALDEDKWAVDPSSHCLVTTDRNQPVTPPFRIGVRVSAAVDRLANGNVELHSTACLEFPRNAGLWCLVAFSDDEAQARWAEPVKAAFRLLADTGIGGERSRGWGHFEAPRFEEGSVGDLIFSYDATPDGQPEPAWWLLSLFSPGDSDSIDWSRGNYSLMTRGGRVESTVRSGESKQLLRLLEEGSVVFASAAPQGSAKNVAPEGFPHPVYRSGFAVAVAIPSRVQS